MRVYVPHMRRVSWNSWRPQPARARLSARGDQEANRRMVAAKPAPRRRKQDED